MVFSSYKFIFLFLPVVWAVWTILKKIKNAILLKWWLILSSCVFYAWGQPKFLAVFLFALIFNYALITGISKTDRKAIKNLYLILGILEGIGILFYFKYLNFTLYSLNRFAGADFTLKNIILPLGISFYTFQI